VEASVIPKRGIASGAIALSLAALIASGGLAAPINNPVADNLMRPVENMASSPARLRLIGRFRGVARQSAGLSSG